MHQNVALRLLSRIMEWDDDRARKEFGWLRLMSRLKYDAYRDFLAGARFPESLLDWLQQFDTAEERQIAYAFVRRRLVYISQSEIHSLIDQFYIEEVHPLLVQEVTSTLGIPSYEVWCSPDGRKAYERLKRQTLFMGLSDGARLDILRHANTATISNEQVVVQTQVDANKWKDLLDDLRSDLSDQTARFRHIFVIDDFTASGTSLIRKKDTCWTGKLNKFYRSIKDIRESAFSREWQLHVHHYIATTSALEAIRKRYRQARAEIGDDWLPENTKFTCRLLLEDETKITEKEEPDFLELVDKYYDPSIENKKHLKASGVADLKRGYGGCALSIILDHNTPNNSLPILWAESTGTQGPAMRPLFRRRQRHT